MNLKDWNALQSKAFTETNVDTKNILEVCRIATIVSIYRTCNNDLYFYTEMICCIEEEMKKRGV